MEKGLNYIAGNFEELLRSILMSSNVNIYISNTLADDKRLPEGFHIQLRTAHSHRMTPISQLPAFLITPEKLPPDVVTGSLVSLVQSCIKQQHYTIPGIINYLYLIDQLGSLPTQYQYDSIDAIVAAMPSTDVEQAVEILITYFNSEYRFSERKSNENLNVEDWKRLSLSAQYLDHFDDPLGILRVLINQAGERISALEMTKKMTPDLRTGLWEFGTKLTKADESQFLSFLHANPQEIPFWTARISDERPVLAVDNKTAAFLIENNWDTAGIYLFRMLYGGQHALRNRESGIYNRLNAFLLEQVTSTSKRTEIIEGFDWPQDFVAFGNWINEIIQTNKTMAFSNGTNNSLVRSFSNFLSNFSSQTNQYIANQKNSYQLSYNDPFDRGAQNISACMVYALLACDVTKFNEFDKAFTTLCYTLKKLFYGSFTASRLAEKMTNAVLCILLTYPKSQEIDIARYEKVIDSFSDIVCGQWVWITEKNDLVRTKGKIQTPNYSEEAIAYILTQLQQVPDEFVVVLNHLKASIKRDSTTVWNFEATDKIDSAT